MFADFTGIGEGVGIGSGIGIDADWCSLFCGCDGESLVVVSVDWYRCRLFACWGPMGVCYAVVVVGCRSFLWYVETTIRGYDVFRRVIVCLNVASDDIVIDGALSCCANNEVLSYSGRILYPNR